MFSTQKNVPALDRRTTKRGQTLCYEDTALAKGGFGEVFEGLLDGKKVAVKRIKRDEYQEIEEKLLDITHPNLVKYLDIWKEAQDFVYITMKFCAGTLEDVVRGEYRGPNPGSTEELLLQTARGLKFLHSLKIIHRDIKPRNILISAVAEPKKKPTSVAKLADFGLCKLKKDDKSYFSKSQDVIGSLGWAAPECIDEDVDRVNFSADVFSLGCVFGYALTGGSHPFGDGSRTSRMVNIMNGKIAWQNENVVENGKMKTLIRSMISKEPEKRPSLFSVVQQLKRAFVSLRPLLQNLILDLCKKMDPDLEDELLEELQFFVDEQLSLNFTDDDRHNPLMLVCTKWFWGDVEPAKKTCAMQSKCIRILLSDAASSLIDINHKDRWGRNALHFLCENYRGEDIVEIAALLIRRGVDVNEKGHWNQTALHYVCRRNNKTKTQEFVKLLLEHGANVDSRTIGGMTPLHFLTECYRGRDICDVMRLLLDAGADVNAKDNAGLNALHWLCALNSEHAMLKEAIVLLIEKGIVNEKTKKGNDAIYYLTNEKPRNVDELVRLIETCTINS